MPKLLDGPADLVGREIPDPSARSWVWVGLIPDGTQTGELVTFDSEDQHRAVRSLNLVPNGSWVMYQRNEKNPDVFELARPEPLPMRP
jgi:hypothetical protein